MKLGYRRVPCRDHFSEGIFPRDIILRFGSLILPCSPTEPPVIPPRGLTEDRSQRVRNLCLISEERAAFLDRSSLEYRIGKAFWEIGEPPRVQQLEELSFGKCLLRHV